MRTCDVREILTRVTRVAHPRPVLVGISGFANSGTSELAELVRQRKTDVVVIRVDGRLHPERSANEDGSRTVVGRETLRKQILEPLLRGQPASIHPGDFTTGGHGTPIDLKPDIAVVVIEGREILHPDLADLFDVRVWLDMSLDEATIRGNRIRRSRLDAPNAIDRDNEPRWSPESPAGGVGADAREAAFFEEFRPDEVADVVFVPVGEMQRPLKIRFMTDSGCDFVLWDPGVEYAEELPDLLPIPNDLRDRIKRWAKQWFLQDGGEAVPDWPGPLAFDRQGYALSIELQDALGPDYIIRYEFSTDEVRESAADQGT